VGLLPHLLLTSASVQPDTEPPAPGHITIDPAEAVFFQRHHPDLGDARSDPLAGALLIEKRWRASQTRLRNPQEFQPDHGEP